MNAQKSEGVTFAVPISGFLSGWYKIANFLYCFRISSRVALGCNSKILYKSVSFFIFKHSFNQQEEEEEEGEAQKLDKDLDLKKILKSEKPEIFLTISE